MDKFLIQFKKSYLLVPIGIIIGLILFFIDSKISDKNITKKEYIKYSLIIGSVIAMIVYITNIKGSIIDEELLSGPTPF